MGKIAASIMCADQMNLTSELNKLEKANVDLLHCDVMDGLYVDNLAMGPYILQAIKETTTIPLDIHLATENPAKYIDMFAFLEPQYMSFHIEATSDARKDIERLQKSRIKSAIAINPETPIEVIFPYLDDIDMVLMMTVNPGFSGQQFNETVLNKLTTLSKKLENKTYKPLIEVDGNINEKTIPSLVECGANVYVLGTSQLFNTQPGSYQDKISRVRALINS